MASSLLPEQHPERVQLHNEIHARPAEIIEAPLAITHIVMLTDAAQREASRAHVAALRDHHRPLPDAATTHVLIDLGAFRLRWEQHTEFVAWTFATPMEPSSVADMREPETAINAVPQSWLRKLPGQCLSSLHLWALSESAVDAPQLVRHMLHADTLVGSRVAGDAGSIYTDFAIHADGFSRMLLLASDELTPRRLGRLVQRLLEIETYRMAALLGLPAARKAASVLATAERELAELAHAIRAADRDTEPALLDRLTRLAGRVESEYAATHSRFRPARLTSSWWSGASRSCRKAGWTVFRPYASSWTGGCLRRVPLANGPHAVRMPCPSGSRVSAACCARGSRSSSSKAASSCWAP